MEVALDLVGIEDVERTAGVEGRPVGDVDERGDGPRTDGAQPLLQPGRARPVAHAAKRAEREDGARIAGVVGEGEAHLAGRLEGVGHGRGVQRLQRPEPRSGKLAGEPANGEAVTAVGGDGNVDDGAFEPESDGCGRADLRRVAQVDDAVVVLADLQLARRAQHALAQDAPDLRALEHRAGHRDHRTLGREDALHAEPHVGCAADHLEGPVLGLDHAQPETVGVGVLAHAGDVADGEGVQIGAAGLDAFELEADGRQRPADRRGVGVGLEVLLEPGQRELHRTRPAKVVGRSRGTKP